MALSKFIKILFAIILHTTIFFFCYTYHKSIYIFSTHDTQVQIDNNPLSAHDHHSHIELITQIQNKSGHIIECNSTTFKYIELLLHELHASSYNKPKWTTDTLSRGLFHLSPWGTKEKQFIRLKHKNGTLYWHKTKWIYSYRTWFLYYFHHLIDQYSAYIPDFDIIIFVSDGRKHMFNKYLFPFFVAEATQKENNSYLLHSIPRSIVRQFGLEKEYQSYFDHRAKELPFNNKINAAVFRGSSTNQMRERVVESFENKSYFDANIICNEQNKSNIYPKKDLISFGPFGNKRTLLKLNKQKKTPFFAKLFNLMKETEEIKQKPKKRKQLKKKRKQIKNCASRMSIENEMQYKYQIVIDGKGARDSFARQIRYKSVILKQFSMLQEFWYHDLKHNKNVIYWKNVADLRAVMNDIQNSNGLYDNHTLSKIMHNAQIYAKTHLNIECMDCFMIHMIQIYNAYFYDEKSIEINKKDMKITLDTIYSEIVKCSKYDNVTNDEIDTRDQVCWFANAKKENDSMHRTFIKRLNNIQSLS